MQDMQRSAATPSQTAAPFFSSLFGNGGGGSNPTTNGRDHNNASSPLKRKWSGKSRPTTSAGEGVAVSPRQHSVLHKERKPSLGSKSSFFAWSPVKGNRRRAHSSPSSAAAPANGGGAHYSGLAHRPTALPLFADHRPVPPIPDLPLAGPAGKRSRESGPIAQSPASADSFSRMLSRGVPTAVNSYPVQLAAGTSLGQQSELSAVHQHIQETANKRISTLDYLRKAHEGRIHWFNTLLFEKSDLQRMPYFDARKLGRRATNYLLLGISLPAVIDLNSNTPAEFLRSLNALLSEFDSFQQLHSENGTTPSSLTRTRIPQMFRRAAAPVSKGRRSSSAAAAAAAGRDGDAGYFPSEQPPPLDSHAANGTGTGTSSTPEYPGGGGVTPMSEVPPAGVFNFAGAEVDLLPGEEYTHLLTPSLPFDPDFFETFATLCDVLIDTYTRLLHLVPTPRECGGAVGELFAKADGKVRKLLIQGVVKEFEEASRAGAKAEVASVGRVVLGGLM
ncbi:hypothetical protein VTK56DRAFT_1038 [Thermocarpiscus australiensis]